VDDPHGLVPILVSRQVVRGGGYPRAAPGSIIDVSILPVCGPEQLNVIVIAGNGFAVVSMIIVTNKPGVRFRPSNFARAARS